MADDAPLLTLRPKIVVGLVPTMVYWLFVAGFLAFYLRTFLYTLSFFFGGVWTGYIVTFVIIWSIAVFVRYMNLKHRVYNFYKDRVEFQEGFLNIDQKTVSYDK